jgi:hypothetical protein
MPLESLENYINCFKISHNFCDLPLAGIVLKLDGYS